MPAGQVVKGSIRLSKHCWRGFVKHHFSSRKKNRTPAGVPAISRGLSEAIPPVVNRESNCTLEGCQQRSNRNAASDLQAMDAATPPGSKLKRGRLFRGCRYAQPAANRCEPFGVPPLVNGSRSAAGLATF